MKNKIKLIIALPAIFLLLHCNPDKEKWPLPMFTIAPNGNYQFYFSGRNVIFNASWSEDYHENGRLTYSWYFDAGESSDFDTSSFNYPFSQMVYMTPGYYNVTLMIKNEQWENAETIRAIHILDSNEFYEYNSYDTIYFSLIEQYLACRDIWEDEGYAWTRNDLAADYGDYSTNCSTSRSGFKYTWENAMNFNSEGFRIPSRNDWEILFNKFGGIEIAGLVFKEPSQTFMDLPYAGKINHSNECIDMGLKAYYWTSDTEGVDSAWAVVFEKDKLEALFIKVPVDEALSVKLVYQQPN